MRSIGHSVIGEIRPFFWEKIIWILDGGRAFKGRVTVLELKHYSNLSITILPYLVTFCVMKPDHDDMEDHHDYYPEIITVIVLLYYNYSNNYNNNYLILTWNLPKK